MDKRIRLEHNSNLFRKWGRIAKAIEIYRLFSRGNSIKSLSDIDSNPRDFIKIATFYYKAVAIKGEDFKKLVRDGRGKTGGKTIVFERLFKVRNKCGYDFKRKTGEIIVKNKGLFEAFINAIVSYLIQYPDTSSRTIDDKGADGFLDLLESFGFPPNKLAVTSSTTGENTFERSSDSKNIGTVNTSNNSGLSNTRAISNSSSHSGRFSVKSKPILKRKRIPSPLKKLIDECYKLDENNFANAKTALTRVAFECTLKYVVENTKQQNGKTLKTSNHFASAYKSQPYTNFDTLKSNFTDLIKDAGMRNAFKVYDLMLIK